MRVKVELTLRDNHERLMFEDLVARVDAWRALTAVERYELTLPVDERQLEIPLAEADISPIAEGGPMPLPPPPEKITIADLEVAVSKYYKGNGLAATKALLEKFGAARVGDVPAEQHAAFLAELTV